MDVSCSAKPCPVILSSSCVFYTGENLIYTGILTNDSVEVALQKIDAKFQDTSIGYIFNNGISQINPGDPVQLGGVLVKPTTLTSNGFLFSITEDIQAAKFITTGGTSSQFVKGDGSLDGTSYQPLGSYITELSGDVIAVGPGNATTTLSNSGVIANTYGSSTQVPVITVDGKGRITAASNVNIALPSASLVFVGDVTGTGTTGSATTLTLATVNSNIYNTDSLLKFSVNAKGLVTSASPISSLDLDSIYGYTPVPNSRTLTINGVTYDLSANRSWTISTGSGTVTSIAAGLGMNFPTITSSGTIDIDDTVIPYIPLGFSTGFLKWDGTDWVFDNTTYYPYPTGTTSEYIRGDGSIATFPIDPKALSVSNDINLTLSLGGTPGTALLQPVSLTLGWTGTLADSRIASAATWNAKIGGSGIANELAYFSGTNTISSLSTSIYPSLTELSYVKGVTSSIQTQLNSKQNTLTNPVTGTGVAEQVTFWTGTNTQSGSNNLIWNNTTGSLSINTTQSLNPLEVSTSVADTGIRLSSNTNPRFTLTRAGTDRLILTATGNIGVISSSSNGLALQGGTTDAIRIFGLTQNVLLGSSGVDAGFRLDVNGTARLNTGTIVSNTGLQVLSSALGFGGISIADSAPIANQFTFGNIFSILGAGSSGNSNLITLGGNLNPTSGTFGVVNITGNPTASSGTANMSAIQISSPLNFTGTYSGIFRGIFYNPTLTSLTGTTHRAIETVSGNVLFGTTSGNVGIRTTNPTVAFEIGSGGQSILGRSLNSSSSTFSIIHNEGTGWVGFQQRGSNQSDGLTGLLGISELRAFQTSALNIITQSGSNNSIIFSPNTIEAARITNNRNLIINTTTDSGFRLDVNGTARIQGKLTQPTTANSPKGTATLVNGVVTINNTLATTGCFIQVNYRTGTALTSTSSILTVSSLVNATSFTVTALNAGAVTTNTSDNNQIEYTITN